MGDLYICKLFFKILFSAHVFFYDNSLGLSFFFCDIRIFMHFCQGEREEGVVDVDEPTWFYFRPRRVVVDKPNQTFSIDVWIRKILIKRLELRRECLIGNWTLYMTIFAVHSCIVNNLNLFSKHTEQNQAGWKKKKLICQEKEQ